MTTSSEPDAWTTVLADLLSGSVPSGQHAETLHALGASLATGHSARDRTRQTILRLLAQREALAGPVADDPEPAVMPFWPGENPQPLPPIGGSGLAGCSIVAVNSDLNPVSLGPLASWFATPADEIVLVDLATRFRLAQVLQAAHIDDPRLRVVRIASEEACFPSQAFNAGFRIARHARILGLAGIVLERNYLSTVLLSGDFLLDCGPPDGSSILLDINRRDLSACCGFNEHLDSAAWMADDLAARLAVLGRRWGRTPTERFSRQQQPPKVEPPQMASLGDVLKSDPELAALRNRFIALVMPEWTVAALTPFNLAEQTAQELVITPANPPTLKQPAHVATEAATHALTELVARRVGGQPIALSARRLEIVLSRPAGDVGPVDVAVAASAWPDLVRSRRAWLVVDVAIDTATALLAIDEVRRLAGWHEFTVVLRAQNDTVLREIRDRTVCPAIAFTAASDPLAPLSLRQLLAPAAAHDIGHSSLLLDDQAVADLSLARASSPAILLRRPKLFIDAQHGLGNRLRAIASAGAIAEASDRELVIIWQPDVHCECQFDDLFEPGLAVIATGFAPEAKALDMDFFNYMEVEPGSHKDAPIRLGAFRDAYLRSAYPLDSPHSTWASENRFLQCLTPNAVVQDLVASVRSPNAVSVHIRMEGGSAAQHLPYESPANWTEAGHREIDRWRQRSHYGYFLPRIDRLVAEGLADTMFLATDTLAVYAEFAAQYGDRVTSLGRKVTDRSRQAIVYALADAILLSRAPLLLGSTWSSFTELAARLAPHSIAVELSGCEF